MKYLLVFFLPVTLIANPSPTPPAAPSKPPAVTFNAPKPICTLVDGKLILARAWPFGNWEDCAYSVLSAAQQLDTLRDQAVKENAALKAMLQPAPTKK